MTGKKGRVTEIYVEILNWDKFNPRKDVKFNSWFRCDHSFFEHCDFDDFSHAELITWLYLLCLASKKSSASITVYTSHANRIGRIDFEDLCSALQKLNKIKVITFKYVTPTLRQRHVGVTSAIAHVTSTCSTNERTNGTNETNGTNGTYGTDRDVTSPPPPTFDFNAVYDLYPNTPGKQEGLQRCVKIITTQQDYENLLLAAKNYARRCEIEKVEKNFIMHFSTFIEKRKEKPYIQPWKDWVDWSEPEAQEHLPNGKFMTFQQQRLDNTKKAVQEFLGDGTDSDGYQNG